MLREPEFSGEAQSVILSVCIATLSSRLFHFICRHTCSLLLRQGGVWGKMEARGQGWQWHGIMIPLGFGPPGGGKVAAMGT